jgi:hypothetical protein
MKTIKSVLFMGLILCASIAKAQVPQAMLNAADVDKFIKTIRPMSDEFEALGIAIDGDNGVSDQIMANAKVMAILKKYGWDNTMWMKWSAIAMCYGKLKMDEQMAALPAEQRAQMKEMMKMAGQSLDTMVNPEDLKVVKAKMSQLDAVMQED